MERNSNIFLVQGNREKIIEFLEQKPQNYVSRDMDSLLKNVDTGKLTFIWTERPNDTSFFPNLILGEKSDLEDLFSWSLTYLRNLGPISAQARIGTYKWFKEELDEDYSIFTQNVYKISMGLIVAEVSYLSKKIIGAEEISVAACQSTLSFALIKSIRSRSNRNNLLELPESWLRAKYLTNSKDSEINVVPIIRCFLSILRAEERQETNKQFTAP